ncbi:hypothetical protein K505DRAFT_248060, partial [Melanomma pulvis-pyrius CBS 109.77]
LRRVGSELFDTTIEDVKIVRDAFVPAPKSGANAVRLAGVTARGRSSVPTAIFS